MQSTKVAGWHDADGCSRVFLLGSNGNVWAVCETCGVVADCEAIGERITVEQSKELKK